jgi:hypothetical protein
MILDDGWTADTTPGLPRGGGPLRAPNEDRKMTKTLIVGELVHDGAVDPVSVQENLRAEASWSPEDLARYVRDRLTLGSFFARKTAVQLWLGGDAIRILQTQLRGKKWVAWWEQHRQEYGLCSVSLAYELLAIREKFDAVEDVHGFTGAEVKLIAGKAKKTKPASQPTTGKPSGDKPEGTGTGTETNTTPQTGAGGNGTISVVTPAQPQDEPVLPVGDLPGGDMEPTQDPEKEIVNQVEQIATAIEAVTIAADRVRPRKLPVDRIRRAIQDLQRLLLLAGEAA